MKTIEISGIRDANGKIPFSLWLKTTLANGFGWQAETDAQGVISGRLSNVLGDEWTLLRGVQLPGLDTPIPMVLIGLPGVYVMMASAARGTYRARGDVWLVLDGAGNMRNASPNLPTRTRLYAEAVRKFLQKNGFTLIDVDAVLLFSRTDAFVENIKAPIRVVLSDGIESYSSSLRLMHPLFKPEECATIIRLLSNPEGKRSAATDPAAAEVITAQAVIMPSAEDAAPVEEPVAGERDLRNMFADASEGPYVSVFSPSAPAGPKGAPRPPSFPPSRSALPATLEAPPPSRGPFFKRLLATLHLSRPQFLILLFGALLDGIAICLLLAVVIFSLIQ